MKSEGYVELTGEGKELLKVGLCGRRSCMIAVVPAPELLVESLRQLMGVSSLARSLGKALSCKSAISVLLAADF